jgi:hypothetical protein
VHTAENPKWWMAGCGALGLLVLNPARARADVTCGSTDAGWNVPSGDAVFEHSPGPVASVLAGVGEYRSHSMLSRGPGGWVTHATSVTPPVNSDRNFLGQECSAPVDPGFLYASTPGLETVAQGAIYTFLYAGGGLEFLAYQSGEEDVPEGSNSAIGNTWLSAGMSWLPWQSAQSTTPAMVLGQAYNGTQIHYGWYQYMNVQGTAQGVPGVNTGVVCSTSLALWQHAALSDAPDYRGDIVPRSYPSNLIGPAASALYNSVYDECHSQMGGTFASFGSFLSTLGTCGTCLDCDLCDEAADQVVNCFANNQCDTSDGGIWQRIVANGTAVSISPDDVACWNQPSNGSGAPCRGAGSSVWGWDSNETVQWNSGGNAYSCWN